MPEKQGLGRKNSFQDKKTKILGKKNNGPIFNMILDTDQHKITTFH